jgi:hypothetical protein
MWIARAGDGFMAKQSGALLGNPTKPTGHRQLISYVRSDWWFPGFTLDDVLGMKVAAGVC